VFHRARSILPEALQPRPRGPGRRAGVVLALWAACLGCALLPAVQARAETKTITVVHTEWYPYTYQEKGQARGFEIEIFEQVMAQMNVKAQFVSLPWKRCLQTIREGKAQALISLLKTPERERYIQYPEEPISVSKTQFFTRADRQIDYGGVLKNLQGLRIGVIAGFSYGPEFDEAHFLDKEASRDAEMLVKKVISGRIDLAAENAAVVAAVARRLGVDKQIRFLNPPIHMQNLYVGFSMDTDGAFLARFSDVLKNYRMTGAYWKILGRYEIY
jgi:polar amino acid transport system substrate-binding protein